MPAGQRPPDSIHDLGEVVELELDRQYPGLDRLNLSDHLPDVVAKVLVTEARQRAVGTAREVEPVVEREQSDLRDQHVREHRVHQRSAQTAVSHVGSGNRRPVDVDGLLAERPEHRAGHAGRERDRLRLDRERIEVARLRANGRALAEHLLQAIVGRDSLAHRRHVDDGERVQHALAPTPVDEPIRLDVRTQAVYQLAAAAEQVVEHPAGQDCDLAHARIGAFGPQSKLIEPPGVALVAAGGVALGDSPIRQAAGTRYRRFHGPSPGAGRQSACLACHDAIPPPMIAGP